jgi:peptidoglycan hydrolase-like protein with peptidoglycan-binding domain
VTPAAVNTQSDITTAQLLLTALGYYRGPIDGIYGGGTRSAVMQFEISQGLPRTGYLTPSLISTMKAAL